MALNWALLYNDKHKETHKVKKYYLNVVEQIPGPEGLRDCLAQCGLLQLPMQVHHAFVRIYNQLLRHPGSLRLYIKDIQAMEEKPLHCEVQAQQLAKQFVGGHLVLSFKISL